VNGFCRVFALWALLGWGFASAQGLPGLTPGSAQSRSASSSAYATAPITLDGAVLFHIAAPIAPLPDQLPLDVRQSYIESALGEAVTIVGRGAQRAPLYDPATMRIALRMSGNQAVLAVYDAKHTLPLPLLTVTSIDAKEHQTTVTMLAQQWRAILQNALKASLLKREPAVERRSFTRVSYAAAALILLTALTGFFVSLLRRRVAGLEDTARQRTEGLDRAQSGEVESAEIPDVQRRRFLALAIRAVGPQRRAALYRAAAAVCLWILVLVWFGALVWGFSLFPQTTPLAHQISRTVLSVLGIWLVTGLVNRLLDVLLARFEAAWRRRPFASSEERARELLRIPTISRALSGFKAFVLVFLAILATLGQIGLPVDSIVTVGGLVAIGLSLAAQNIIRDFVNGFLVLFEDQYAVGDYVTMNAQSGIVEYLSLRMAQIRDAAGSLITIPHSTVTNVINRSRNWSRIDYRVPVDPASDVTKALALVNREIAAVAEEERWRDAVLVPVEWIGIDALSRDGVVIRASMKTAPLRQFELRREINARVRDAFAGAGIAYGAPLADVP
jgi:small-conductance mechanosensitive channel